MALDCNAVAQSELDRLHDIQVLLQALCTALGYDLSTLPLVSKL